MAKYICSVCGFVYDESQGIPEAGIAPGTRWEDLPHDWVCPLCGAEKSEFEIQADQTATQKKVAATVAGQSDDMSEEEAVAGHSDDMGEVEAIAEHSDDMEEMTALEVSALCTNLARGCEKQYKPNEAALFLELAEYFKAASAPAEEASFDKLFALIERDLGEGLPNAKSAATDDGDRGALRALVWSEKVTRILKSITGRYLKEGDKIFEHTGVYVCTICGFIYIGDTLPEVCPVCKVPNWKFEKVEGRK